MKKTTRVIAAVSAVFLILSLSTLAADATANQNVVLSLVPDTTGVAAIRVFDGTNVSPDVTFNDGYSTTYSVTTAGDEATDNGTASPDFGGLNERSGGSIQYTVRGLSAQKITVHSATSSYNANTLYVVVDDLQDASAESVTGKGTLVTSTDNDPDGSRDNVFYIDNTTSGSAQDIITGIPGTNTYTGTAKSDVTPGAPISYGFISDPGVTTITVTYTILADS